MLATIVHSTFVKGAVAGLLSAAVVDLHAFLTWKSVSDVKSYSWSTALLRWGQGVIVGGLTGAGYGAVIS